MKHSMPQEIEVWYILPAIRKELTIELGKNGLAQREIAKKLGITESAVSQYISKKRASKIKFNESITNEIKKSAKKIIKNSHPMSEIQRISTIIRKSMMICEFHHAYEPELPKNCRMCLMKKKK